MSYNNQFLCLAARVLQNVDNTVDPCDNFYDFACGGWKKSHVIPSDRGNLYAYGVLREEVNQILKGKLFIVICIVCICMYSSWLFAVLLR